MMTDPAASRPGTHLDPDQLADLVEGLLAPVAADAARAHLASCPLCSGDFALIAGEDGAPGADPWSELLPAVEIPRDVAVRVEAALHREPPLSPAGPAGASHGTPATPAGSATHTARPRRRRRFGLALGGLAGATLAVVAGVGILSSTDNGNNSTGSAASGAARHANAAPSSPPNDGSHAATVPGGPLSPALGAQGTGSAGDSYGAASSIEKQAEDLLGQRMASPASGTAQAAKPQCTPSPVASGAKPLVSTRTEYQGKQAWLLVYAEPGTPSVADVYVVDLDACISGDSAQVAYQTTVPRG
jgi:hypothetical protein